MKKRILSIVLALFLMLFTVGSASAFLNDFGFDIDGVGGNAPVTINEFFDVIGFSLIVNTITDPIAGTGTFDDYGVIQSVSHDSTLFPWISDFEFTGILDAEGIFQLGGPFTFTGGFLNMYSQDTSLGNNYGNSNTNGAGDSSVTADGDIYGANDGTLIATWDVTGGSGIIDPSGIPNGQITIAFEATFLAPNIFFDEDGVDLSTTDPLAFVLGWSTTNGSQVANPTDEVQHELSEFAGLLTKAPVDGLPGFVYASANGQYRLNLVPEPSTIFLMGLGLIGLAGLARKKYLK